MSRVKIFLGFLTLIIILSSAMLQELQAAPTSEISRDFSPVADAYVPQASPNENFGSYSYLFIQSWLSGSNHLNSRGFIRFDLSTIPPGSKIKIAVLCLYMREIWPSGSSRDLFCHRVSQTWDENTITWNNQPSVTLDHYHSISTGTSPGWLYWNVTYWVQKFAAKDTSSYAENYGWRIRDCSEDSIQRYYLSLNSREASSNKPYLQVNYIPPHLELSLESTTLQAGNWVKMTVYRKTEDGEAVTRGSLKVKLSSTSTSTNKKFSLTPGGAAITELKIDNDKDHKDFYYYDDKAGTWEIQVWTEDYLFFRWSGSFLIPVPNYGDDKKQLTVTPGPLDRFVFDAIPSPKQVATPFSITITAYDAFGNVKTDYTGTNSLTDTTGTINPTVTGAFVNGKWTGMVTINKVGKNVKITTSGAGKTGESNAFDVKAGPPAKLVITPSSFTMAAGVTYSYLNISLRDVNNFETTHTSNIIVSLSTTSSDGEFREFGTTNKITGVVIHAGLSFVKVDYYDIKSGTQTLTASATGLTSGTATVIVIPDTTPPVTTMTVGSPKYTSGTTTYVSGSTVFTLSASDDASGVKETKYRVDGGSWSTYTAELTFSTLSDGSHTIGYYSIDKSGNNEAEKTITIMMDNTPPAISGASPTGSLVQRSTSVTFALRVEDSGSGVKEVRLIVDGISQGTMTAGSDYSKTISLSEGSHTWSIEAVDNVDNTATWSGSFTLTVDTAPPTISGLSAPSNPVFGESITIMCEASDTLSGVDRVTLYYSTNGGASWTEVAMTLQAGRYTGSIPSQMPFTNVQYYVEAVDGSGNKSSTTISTLTVGIPMWVYIVGIVVVVVIAAALLLRRKPSPRETYAPPPPPPPR